MPADKSTSKAARPSGERTGEQGDGVPDIQ